MIILAQASDGSTWIFFAALGIAIGLVALGAWLTHCIWFFKSFGLFRAIGSLGKDNVVQNIIRKKLAPLLSGRDGTRGPHRRDNPWVLDLGWRWRSGWKLRAKMKSWPE